MNYSLSQLQIFLKIVKTRSITKASEELFMTQPAVSIQLKNFQKQFDIPLTEIVGRQLYVTEFGLEIADLAEKIIEQVNEINIRTHLFKGQLTGKIKLAVVSTGKYVIPYFLTDFLHQHPEVELQMDVTNKSTVIQSLENNEVDFALVSILPKQLSIDSIQLLSNELFVVSNEPTKSKRKLSVDALKEMTLIYRESGSGTRQTMEGFLQDRQIQGKRKIELATNEAVKQAVIAGLGNSIMPVIGLRNELLNKQLHIIPTHEFPLVTAWHLIWLSGKNHAPAAASWLEYVKSNNEQIINQHFGWRKDVL